MEIVMENNDVLKGNLDILCEKYPYFADRYVIGTDDLKEDALGRRGYIDYSVDNKPLAVLEYENRYWYVNSRYNPENDAKVWAEQFNGYNRNGIVVILGLGNGMHIRELLKILDSTNYVMVVEPSVELFYTMISNIDMRNILEDQRVILEVTGVSDGVFLEFMTNIIDYSTYKITEIYSLNNYNRVYQDSYKYVIDTYKSTAELIILNRNTYVSFSDVMMKNLLFNYNDIIEQYTINELKKHFDEIDKSEIPAIIVAAGPSLDKNVKQLKKAEGKALIIVVDTALKPVLNAGIEPDLAVLVDPKKPLILFEHEKIKDIPMVVSYKANHKVLEKQKARRFYFGEPSQYITYIYKKHTGLDIQGLENAGSVANVAFSLAVYLGFKNIILVGQDLAFKGNQSHVSSAYGENVDKAFMTKVTRITQVEGIDGGMVETMKNMEAYLRWFERQIVIHDDIEVIDATEGGAKKKGAVIMTLEEAIKNKCRGNINVSEIIEKTRPAFSEDERKNVYEEFLNIPVRLGELKKQFEAGTRDYYRFYELYRKGKTATKEFNEKVRKISQVNDIMNTEPLGELISMYNAKDNFDVLEDMHSYKATEAEEIKDITDKGVKMTQSYKKAIEELEKDIPILLEKIK